MRLPSKVISYYDSTLSKFPVILRELRGQDLSPLQLYGRVWSRLEDVGEFMDVLDCLYALRRIELRDGEGVLHYVDRDTV